VRDSRSAQGGGVVVIVAVAAAAAAAAATSGTGEGGTSEELKDAVVSDWFSRSVSQGAMVVFST